MFNAAPMVAPVVLSSQTVTASVRRSPVDKATGLRIDTKAARSANPSISGASTEAGATHSGTPAGVPRVVGSRFQDGVFTPIYDPKGLKEWREAHGIEETKMRSPPPPGPAEQLPLLPLFTGGHDPPTSAPTVTPTPNSHSPDCSFNRAPGSQFVREPKGRPLSEYPRGPLDMDRKARMAFNDDSRRLNEAVARQTADAAARERIRAQLSRSLRFDSHTMSHQFPPILMAPSPTMSHQAPPIPMAPSPTLSHKLVPVPVPFASTGVRSGARRGSVSSSKYDDDRAYAPMNAQAEPRKRSPKTRQEWQPLSPRGVGMPLPDDRAEAARLANQGKYGGW